ncbi:MAG TPA: CehA/McbA family metallohydrolase [Pyrinomonadaceae bacterium]|nr:CehA/McbA family metallohydrolase [Pyrinomonadaceae bacterium]
MRRFWKLLLLVFFVALLTQTPFIYRRYQLGRLNAKIQELNSARTPDADPVYADYKGAIHVHSFLGGHSAGTFAEIERAAQQNGLAFVVMTEHPSGDYDTRALTLRGVRGGVLFVQGSETSESDANRLLTFGGTAATAVDTTTATGDAATISSIQENINRAKAAGGLVFIAHPETFRSWREVSGFDGMEIYNLHADAAHINRVKLFFDGLWSYRSYPHLLWTRFSQNPDDNLRRFDQLTAREGRKVVAIAGNDAHANIGVSFKDLSGHTLFEIKLDPYERSFQVVRTHVLVERVQPLNEENLLDALARGHAYVSFDILCDASGFRFSAGDGAEQKLMGDEITRSGAGVRLHVETPVRSRIVIVRNGQAVSESQESVRHEWTATEAGVYRVVCYLPQLPAPLDAKPWIISNPIYVR